MHNKRLSKTSSSINSNSQAAEQNPQLAYRPFGSQIQKASAAPVTQSTKEDVAFAEQKMEAFGLELQAKYGKITPEGQERLTVLQAKMASFSSSQLEHARRFSHNIANIPLRRPDTPIQAKLTIGEPGDKYEQEADETARQVVQRIHQPQSDKLQRESLPDEEEFQMKPMVQRRVSDGGMAATQDLEASINQARGGGQPLANNIREPMEQGFGADFSRVKVHTDTQADQLNRSIQAKAFTTGQDVFFRQGAYEPGSRGGQELIAHELTHVVQQNGGAVQRFKDNGKMEKIGSVPDFYEQINQLGEIDRTRHHIVPKDTLMNFYNAVHSSGDLAQLKGELKELATNSLNNYGFKNVTFEQFQAAKKERPGEHAKATEEDWKDAGGRTEQELHNEIENLVSKDNEKHAGPKDSEAAEIIEKMYQWFPGNLVIGPGGRKDDPGNRFEDNADKLLPANDFENLKTMYQKMEEYKKLALTKASSPGKKKNKALPQVDEGAVSPRLEALNSVIECLKKAMKREQPYEYNEEKWDISKESGPKIKQ
ncbi:MAG: DUF4157 domain-containing protein [Nostoc sp.]|uniref:eCIS core domain-containing protein n=1 Tax=Nostoc sp. TaxID=1180 RepID=UPI002FFADA57